MNPLSKVNTGVVSETKKCHFASLLPSRCAMMLPLTIMTSRVDCWSSVAPDLKQASQLPLAGTFLSPSQHYFHQYSFPKCSHHPHSATFLSPFPPKPTLLVVYIPRYLSSIEKRFGFINTPQTKLIKKYKITQVVPMSSGGRLESMTVACSYARFTDATSEMSWSKEDRT